MQINKHPSYRLIPLILLTFLPMAALLLPTVLSGAEKEPVTQDQPVTVVRQTEPPAQQADTDRQNPDPSAQQAAPANTAPVKPMKEFKPSETIGADSAVSFPIDI